MLTIDDLDVAFVGRRLYITKAKYHSDHGWHVVVKKRFHDVVFIADSDKMRTALVDILRQDDEYTKERQA